jgi:hypothetical protein
MEGMVCDMEEEKESCFILFFILILIKKKIEEIFDKKNKKIERFQDTVLRPYWRRLFKVV